MTAPVDRRLYMPVLVLLKPPAGEKFRQLLMKFDWPEADIHVLSGTEQIPAELKFEHDHAWLVFVDSSLVDPHQVAEYLPARYVAFIVISFENARAHDLSLEPDLQFDHIIRASWFTFESEDEVLVFFQRLADVIHEYVRDNLPGLQPSAHLATT